jgi:RNA polymerase sigma factor (sigma-70 family)
VSKENSVDNPNPLSERSASDAEDMELVRRAQTGSREALEGLIRRHQPWIYNISLRMLYWPHDAEDTTQEILVKLITKLSTFQGKSTFRTWLYRIVVNHVLNQKRRDWETRLTFGEYGRSLDGTPDLDLPDPTSVPVDVQLMIEEAKIGCTSGMLLCLDRDQRLIYILGEIFGVTDLVGAELLEISRENFRQKLARSRRELHNFMQEKCGLVNEANPCRCAKKTQGFMKAGYLDPQKLLFARARVTRVHDVAEKKHDDLEALDKAYAEIHRGHPFHEPPDFVQSLRELMNRPDFKSIVEFE